MTLFVGNLKFEITEQDLVETFSQYGNVTSARLMTDRDDGRSRGFAFVDMPNRAEALASIQALNGADWGGRAMTVKEAEERVPRGQRTDPRNSRW